ncbi:hypothetical protein P691DRAFT_808555 [Macrolepiota fuliginosa MF-IS2]|uniref:Yeast cell wall synthesis Kre9/Knh1-like N-terminal domain-containing protein n=1 Tax=Macrolepiota fuliginosa MF-IS2 TaxID=1400762 RepID=A0A9P5XRK7_9AGAR|nr:hypothetical protein P691DRAFT_808555 [Macrolepiota fuliginosa MF-IS2]
MVSSSVFALITVLASALVARADVVPSEPSPGAVYREGQTCPIVWEADPDSPTAWKNMNIELMTGDNFDMQHLTTVATNQDGTVNGRFQFPCPGVTINAPIYFYQFTSPSATDKTWTTRFTIASTSGQTVPAPNATQPGSGEAIPWGVGALTNPAGGVPPPSGAGGGSAIPSGSASTSGVLSTTSSALVSSVTLATSPSPVVTPPGTPALVVTNAGPTPSTSSGSASPSQSNSASAMSATFSMTPLILSALSFMFI